MTTTDTYKEYESPSEMIDSDQQLIEFAQKALATSHSPYSNFRVGCAISLENGEVITGSNQENASFPAGTCAENVTLNTCSTLYPQTRILSLAVVAQRHNGNQLNPVTPCGICRQVLLEFESRQKHPITLLMKTGNKKWIKTINSAMLLPFSFTKENL